jgi:hypothetical protein
MGRRNRRAARDGRGGRPRLQRGHRLRRHRSRRFGYYAFGDYAWNRFNSAGVQYSAAEIPDAAESDVSELEVYYTHWISEFHRVRLVFASIEDETSEDAIRVAIQYTGIVGAHGHGINW